MKYQFIANHQEDFPVRMMCHLLNVARSSYYVYQYKDTRITTKREQDNAILLEKIKMIFETSKHRYGSPRVHKKLRQQGDQLKFPRYNGESVKRL